MYFKINHQSIPRNQVSIWAHDCHMIEDTTNLFLNPNIKLRSNFIKVVFIFLLNSK